MEDLEYAKKLWDAMEQNRLVVDRAMIYVPYKGVHPHGEILDAMDGYLVVNNHDGRLIVKRNYGGEGVSKEIVANDPAKYLQAITVMYKREKGYDPENLDWFRVKYDPKGQVLKNPKGIPLAGRVAKGNKKEGCFACHAKAPKYDHPHKGFRSVPSLLINCGAASNDLWPQSSSRSRLQQPPSGSRSGISSIAPLIGFSRKVVQPFSPSSYASL